MKLSQLLADWEGSQLENHWNRRFILGLLVIVLLLTIQVWRKESIVVLHPVTLSEEAWVTKGEASHSYKEAWGFYLAQLIGNVTPSTLEFVKHRLQPLLAPNIYQEVMDVLQIQAQQIQNNRLTLRFEPRSVEYEAATGKVFVFGQAFEKGVSDRSKRCTERTYETVIRIGHYGPLISALDTYQGSPRTLEVLEKEAQAKAEEQR